MNKNFIDKLDEEITYLESSFETKTEKLIFLDNYIKNNQFNSLESIVNTDLSMLAIALIISQNKKISLTKVNEIIENNKDFINNSSADNLYGVYDKISTEIEKSEGKITKNIIKKVEKIGEEYGCNIDELLELFSNSENDEMFETLRIIYTFKKLKEEMSEIKEEIDKTFDKSIEEFGYRIPSKYQKNGKYRNKYIEKQYKQQFDIKKVVSLIKPIETYCIEEEKRIKRKNRSLTKTIENYKQVRRVFLKESKWDEIVNIRHLAAMIKDEELLKAMLKEIYYKNIDVYLEVEKEYDKLSSDYQNRIKMILDKHNINCDVRQIKKSIEVEDLDYELRALKRIGFSDNKTIINIVNSTDKEKVEVIYKLYNGGCITGEFIINNTNIFNDNLEGSSYYTLIRNIKTIKDNDINLKNFCVSSEVLITDNDIFSKNIEVLNEYNLKEALRNIKSYKFLTSEGLDNKIDMILELGFEKMLVEDLSLLNYSNNSWKKVLIMKEIGEIPTNLDKLKVILENNELIMDSELNEYLCSDSNNENIDDRKINIEKLRQFEDYSRTFNINGILISKNKVYRNCTNNEVSISDIIKNSIISEDEYNELKSTLLPIEK